MRLTSPTSTAFTQYFVVLRTKDSAGAGAPPVCGEGCVLAPKGLVRVIDNLLARPWGRILWCVALPPLRRGRS